MAEEKKSQLKINLNDYYIVFDAYLIVQQHPGLLAPVAPDLLVSYLKEKCQREA